jgi:hypothetical protein
MVDEHTEKHLAALADTVESRFSGKYRGIVNEIVTDTGNERENMGFITVQIPEIYYECSIPLVKPCVSFAGEKCGFFAFPKKGDHIWIEFEGGDQSRPIWSGFWWKKGDIPDFVNLDTVGLVSRTGHRIILNDKNGTISLVHAKGPEIALTKDEITFKVGRTKMVISGKGVNINGNTFEVKTS